MTLQTYPEYKTTGLDWASYIPISWEVVPVKHVCTFSTGWTPPSGNAEHYAGDNLWANISDVGPRILDDTAKRLSDKAVALHGMSPSPVGSLLFSFKLSIGQVSFVGSEMYTNEAIATFLPSAKIDLSFAYYAFPQMIPQNASENIYGAKMLNQQLIQSAKLVLPPLAEQAAVAAFLDCETAKIDALMKEQRQMVELLREKRQAVISRVVMKGLDPNVPMKPSGVEWLGEVPEHWEVSQLRHVARKGTSITYGIVQAGPDTDGGIPYIRTSDMAGDKLSSDGYLRTSLEIDAAYARSKVTAGDVVIAIRATIGKPLIVPPFLEGANLTQGTAKFSPDASVLAEFICHFLRSSQAIGQFERLAKGATFKEITLEMLRKFQILRPPVEEQRRLIDFLASKVAELDRLILEAENAIALLQERRNALIGAAVTGEIDVRGVVEAEARVPEVVAA
ncbi:restriction endonuclease subunit S [Bradyrhizobium barranii subsp. apii]|uniref:restriction endonuclease subunit S n=1 Tax=Bradyrhizobium barranii TaxID=2992140 RepID=UPI001AA0DEFF|nr:restriction endonuclease subunit S [Bradyrhizobium barranii]UPT97679.1 restriction endonuclease subunit S [Bradyrhizobium barranii subsp. apii]